MEKPSKHLVFRAILLVAALYCAMASVPGWAKTDKTPAVRGSLIRDYARITFEWPQTTYFTAKTKGNDLIITFDRKANPDMGALLTQLSPYVTHVQRKPDGKTIIVSLDRPYRIRTFVSERINGVDLLGVDVKAHRKTALAKAKPAPEKEPAKIAANTPSVGLGEKFAALSPAAGEEAAAAMPVPAPVPAVPAEPAAAPVAAPAEMPKPPVPELAPAAGTTEADKPAAVTETKPETKPAVDIQSGDSTPTPPSQLKLPSSDTLKINISAATDSAVIRLPFNERVAVAAFRRNRYLWLVFNKAMPLDLTDFDTLPRTVIGKAQWIKSLRSTVLRMPIDDGVYINLAKEEEDSLDWAILLTSKKHTPMRPMKVMVNTEPPSPAHVFIPALDAADPVTVTDPQIGDKMIVTPFFNTDHGLTTERDFVEFTMLQTAQGLAVVKKADAVSVVLLRNGLRVSMPGGSTFTPGLPEVREEQVTNNSVSVPTLFPYEFWKIEATTNPRLYTNALFHRIAEANTPQEANEIRLRLAQYYLGEGMAPEAFAFLEGINRTNPSYFRSAKLAALRGAANFLMYRFIDAARDFSSSELNNNKEIDYWRNMLADLLGSPDQAYDYMALNPDYFSKYPPMLRQRLAIVAADRSIANKEYNSALKIFDSLHQDKQMEAISTYINFLMAKISSDTGQEEEALAMWDKLADDFKWPFVRANAEFARIIWGMDHGKLTKAEGADKLERLRLSWHGDSLELQVLTLLGEIYSEKKDYINAMRIWHGAIQSFPNTATAITMTRKMQEAFIAMFNEGKSDELPPLEALALYYEYRSYTPSGSTGDEMMERLADRLISVDLLDQAAALLDHQMKFQVEKEKRSRVGTKLATIHLLNHQPKKALQALQDSVYGENSLLLKLYRNRLTAEAMMAMGESDRALQTLGQDNSADAERIRLGVYWHERDWQKIITSVEAVLKERPDSTAPINLDESELLLKLSLAYVFKNDTEQLRYLRDYFGPLMQNNPNKPAFDFITSPDIILTTRNFEDVVTRLTNTRTFIQNYNARIQTAGLDSTINPGPVASNP